MNIKRICSFLIAVIIPISGINTYKADAEETAAGCIYYVDAENGNDNNDGISQKNAWKSLERVNSTEFFPGDEIRFKANTSYTGMLEPKGSGTPDTPIKIDMYGNGAKPIIDARGENESALYMYNQQGWEISNLRLTNDDDLNTDYEDSTRYGVRIVISNMGEAKHIYLKGLEIVNVDGAANKGSAGISISVKKTSSKDIPTHYSDVLTEGCYVENTDRNAIYICGNEQVEPQRWHWKGYISENVVVRNNIVKDVTGNGIIVSCCEAPLIEYNTAIHCCTKTNIASCGIWVYATNNAVMQFNEAYACAPAPYDGEGFDIDHCTTQTTVQYNYSHDNATGFLNVCSLKSRVIYGNDGVTQNDGSIVRYNISQNDKKSGITINGEVTNLTIYNNTFYSDENNPRQCIFIKPWNKVLPHNVKIYNNIFDNRGGGGYLYYGNELIESGNGLPEASHNLYYGKGSINEAIKKDTDGIFDTEPGFLLPGSGKIGIETVKGYMLKSDSPCIDAGMVIENNGGRDYFGNKLYNNKPDIGAAEYYSGFSEYPSDIEASDEASIYAYRSGWLSAADGVHFDYEKKMSELYFGLAAVKAAGFDRYAEKSGGHTSFSDVAENFYMLSQFNTLKKLLGTDECKISFWQDISVYDALRYIIRIGGNYSVADTDTEILKYTSETGMAEGVDLTHNRILTHREAAQLLYNGSCLGILNRSQN